MADELQRTLWKIRQSLPQSKYEKFEQDAKAFFESYDAGDCNPLKCKKLKDVSVSSMISVLKTYPQASKISVCWADEFYIHLTQDRETIIIDIESDNRGYTNLGKEILDDVLADRERYKK